MKNDKYTATNDGIVIDREGNVVHFATESTDPKTRKKEAKKWIKEHGKTFKNIVLGAGREL